jgi:hypothetical protein
MFVFYKSNKTLYVITFLALPLFQCSRPRSITRIHVQEGYSDEFQLKHLCVAVVYNGKRYRSPLVYTEDYMTNFDEMFVFHR